MTAERLPPLGLCRWYRLEILSLKGSKLHTIDTKMLHNSFAAIHPTGEFFACAGFTPDVKVWAVTESVAGQVSEVWPFICLALLRVAACCARRVDPCIAGVT